MTKKTQRSISGLIVAAAVATGTFAIPANTAFADDADAMLPADVSADRPARVVSTILDATGRPVITVRTATNRSDARHFIEEGRQAPRSVGVEMDAQVHTVEVPTGTDPDRAQQWDFTKLAVASAWPYSTGSGVTVAVIDTGVDAGHPDLTGNVLTGYDVINKTTGTSADPNGHGTHVAGTIAALTGNGVGVSSIAPDVKILPIRVLDANGSGNMSDAATGIVYAADHGANVINMSLGASSQLAAVTQAIAYARGKGVTVVAAAGNDGEKGSPASYPGADPGVIAVAATDSSDQVASFSTKGSYVDVAAPGVSILSTLPTSLGSYGTESGTSMASPHVAAVAALLKAYEPDWTPDQIEQTLENTAVDLGAAGKDTSYGYGRISPTAALAAAAATSTPTPTVTPSATATPTPTVTPTSAAPTATPTSTATATPKPTTTTAPAKVTPFIYVSTGNLDVAYGSTITTRYTVTVSGRPMTGQSVQICTSTAGAAFTCQSAITTTAGTVTASTTATANRRIRLTVAATNTSVAVTSATTSYTVRPRVTVTRPGARSLKITMAGVGGQRIQLQRHMSSGWVLVHTYPAASSRVVTGLVAGAGYRVVVPGTAAFTAATSGTVKA